MAAAFLQSRLVEHCQRHSLLARQWRTSRVISQRCDAGVTPAGSRSRSPPPPGTRTALANTHVAGNSQAASSKYEHGIGEGFSTSGGVELAEAAARLFQQAIFEARTMSRMRRLAASL